MNALRGTCLATVASAMLAIGFAAVPVYAQVAVQVPGSANLYLAGMPPGSACCGGTGTPPDTAPQQSPVQVGIQLVPGAALTFSASGSVSNATGVPPTQPPDGGDFIPGGVDGRVDPGTPSANNIAAVNAPLNSLVGVFLNDSVPTSSPTPPALNFDPATGLGLAFGSLSPGLKQVFFIGDGRTGTGTGNVQQFIVPAGATRLFLGTIDGVGWANNTGAFNVQVNGGGGGGGGAAIAAAVLPSSRSVLVGATATAFVSIINAGPATATGCGITPVTGVPSAFLYQTTNAANQLIGTPNTPANIPPGGIQTYLVAFVPQAAFGPTDVVMNFQCSNTAAAPTFAGINTLLLTASATPVPDIIAISATGNPQNIAILPGGAGAFAVASTNLGVAGPITVTVDTGGTPLPLAMTICPTNAQAACVSPPQSQVTVNFPTNQPQTFSVFVAAGGAVPLNPGANRIYVRFRDAGGVTRGSTSVAVQTQ
jgi:hypothetical protein